MGNFLFSEFNSNILALDMGSWAMHMHCPYRLQDSIDQSKTSGKKKKKMYKSATALNMWKSVINVTEMIKNLWTIGYRCDWIVATQNHEGESSSSSR